MYLSYSWGNRQSYDFVFGMLKKHPWTPSKTFVCAQNICGCVLLEQQIKQCDTSLRRRTEKIIKYCNNLHPLLSFIYWWKRLYMQCVEIAICCLIFIFLCLKEIQLFWEVVHLHSRRLFFSFVDENRQVSSQSTEIKLNGEWKRTKRKREYIKF